MFSRIDTEDNVSLSSDKYSTGKDKKRDTPGLEPVSVNLSPCFFENLCDQSFSWYSFPVLHFI